MFPARRPSRLLFVLLLMLFHLLLGHTLHRALRHAATGTEVGPNGEHAEVKRCHRPDDIHDPHLLRMTSLIKGDHDGAGERKTERHPSDCV